MMDLLATFQSERLQFRPVEDHDAAAVYDLYSDPVVMAGMPGLPVYASLIQGQDKVDRLKEIYAEHALGLCAVEERTPASEPRLIGLAGLMRPDDTIKILYPNALEIGYLLHPAYWGKGYATEAAMAWIERTWSQTQIDQIVASIAPNNMPSQSVARQCGMDFSGAGLRLGYPNKYYVIRRP